MVGKYKFKVGDVVIVKEFGSGVAAKDQKRIVRITKLGEYLSKNGYKVEPKIGNSLTGEYKGFIGENTFRLVNRGRVIHELW